MLEVLLVVASVAMFLSKSELSMNPEILDCFTNSFFYLIINYFIRKSIIIRCGKIFTYNV